MPEFAAGTQSQIDVKLTAQNESRALSAEKLATVASLVDHRWKPSGTAIDSMWDSILLMNEHTWGWGRTVTEPHSEDSVKELAYKRLRATVAFEKSPPMH